MADISQAVSSILSDPEALEQIRSLGSMLGIGEATAAPEIPPQKHEAPGGLSAPDPEFMGMMMKLAPLMSAMNEETDSTRLLYALKPFLSDKRRGRVDKAVRLMSLMKVVPMLKESGIGLI